MEMSPSQKARLISFVAMWAVVAWHCYCGSRVERWFIPVFCYWSVPWFFLVSGFFFVGSFEKRELWGFITYKLRSLLAPYVIWCLVGFFCFVLCSPGQVHYSINAIFAFGEWDVVSPSYNPPLWYIRALLIFTVVGATILQFLKFLRVYDNRLRALCFFLLFGLLILCFIVSGVKLGPMSSSAYFLSGATLYYFLRNTKRMALLRNYTEMHTVVVAIGALVVAIALRLVWFAMGHSFSLSGQGGMIIGNCSVMVFIIALWHLINGAPCGFFEKAWYMRAGLGVFVYFMHRPLLMWLIERFSMSGNMLKDVMFMLLVVLYAPFCLLIGLSLCRFMPKTYSILIGGR